MRSMFRCVLVVGLLSGRAGLAEPPKFSEGGFLFSLMYGPGLWGFNRTLLAEQVGAGNADILIADAVTSHTVSLRAAYNILGHASLGVDFSGTGWDISNSNRGGAGFLTGFVAWHPLELVWMKKQQRPIGLDVSTMFGVGYGIMGEQRGMDGLVLQWGLNADYFFARYFGLGLFAKGTFLQWDKFYVNYNDRSVPGNTLPVPKGTGGSFWTLGITLIFRAGN
jgi:hypothetical protein